MQLPQLGSRLDPERLDEHRARLPKGLQRVGLATGAVEREHQLAVQALAQRMLDDQTLELRHQLAVPAGAEIGLHASLQRRQPLLLQPRDLRRRERVPRQGIRRGWRVGSGALTAVGGASSGLAR